MGGREEKTVCEGPFAAKLLQIVHEDPRYLIVDKPGGWLTIPSRQGADDGRKVLHHEWQTLRGERLFVVHRLDAEVTGLVLFARTAEAHRTASMWFEGHVVQKTYEGWTDRFVPLELKNLHTQVLWECVLARGKKRAYEAAHGKASKTGVVYRGEVQWQGKPCSRIHLQPFTGRSHQLRFEMFRHGLPLIGDRLYGSERDFIAGAIALRAVRLDFSSCAAEERAGLPPVIEAPDLRDYFQLKE